MATFKLTSTEYWQSRDIDIRLNPGVSFHTKGLRQAISEHGFDSAVVLATSGTEGKPKYVVLKKSAILHAAKAVNQYCNITEKDSWLGGLSTFHIGGLAIYARAVLSNSIVHAMDWNQWTRDGQAFNNAVKDATLTSLTPIHLYDLAKHQIPCPKSLRGVFIGGGRLDQTLADRAKDLGYPLWTTYGMTETCSQVATSLTGGLTSLPILPHWQTKISKAGNLQVKGQALMSGYFTRANNQWHWNSAIDEYGYFETSDIVAIENHMLTPLGRADQQIKILGELVSLVELETKLAQHSGCNCILWAKPEPRRGFELFACLESKKTTVLVEQINKQLPPFKALREIYTLSEFPRTEVGKIDRNSIIKSHLM